MTDIATIAKGLSKAQRETVLNPRWIHPGGMEPIALVEFTGVWPEGVAQFFTFRTDRLTPLGLSVRSYLMENTDDQS